MLNKIGEGEEIVLRRILNKIEIMPGDKTVCKKFCGISKLYLTNEIYGIKLERRLSKLIM